MGYVTIANKLTELVDQIEGIEAVYDHNPNELEVYPSATITAVGHRNGFQDTAANTRTFTFLIRLFYRLDADQDAETILRDLTDKVIEKLEANVVVQDVWDIAQPTEGVFRSGEREVPVLVSEITVNIKQRALRNV